MDSQDVAILRELFRDARASHAQLGARVGLSPNAVKSRIRRLSDEGVLQGFVATPRPDLLGLREGLLLFTEVADLDEREDELLQNLPEVPGVRFADVALDGAVYVWVLARDEDDWERIERAAISLVGKPPARRVWSPEADDARSDLLAPLPHADWRIARALLADSRRASKDIAKRAGLTAKPLKRRLSTLVRSGRLRLEPVLSPMEASKAVLFRVILLLHEGADPRPALAALPADAFGASAMPGLVSAYLERPTPREARRVQRALRAAPGVERALLQIAARRSSPGWLDEMVARQSERATAPPPAAAPPLPVPQAR